MRNLSPEDHADGKVLWLWVATTDGSDIKAARDNIVSEAESNPYALVYATCCFHHQFHIICLEKLHLMDDEVMPALGLATMKMPQKSQGRKRKSKTAQPPLAGEPGDSKPSEGPRESDPPGMKYYSSLAKIFHTWRAHARDIYDMWADMHGAAEALKVCRKVPPQPLSGRWGQCAALEENFL